MQIKPEYEGLMRTVLQWTQWTYKGKTYQVMTVTPGMLSQDAKLDEWCPTVIYVAVPEKASFDTHIAALDLRFCRPITEFCRKFTQLIPEKVDDSK